MAESPPLCDYCSQIPFLAMPASGKYYLGSWSRIFASRCRFCQLVQYAYCESYRNDPRQRSLPSTDLTVSWSESRVFFKRPAFRNYVLPQQEICFITQSSHVDKNNAYLRSSVEAELDVSKVSHWISTCITTHGSHCALDDASFASVFPGLHVLRLIDVMQHCLVETRELHRYVALSYIWGAVSNFKLTKSNLSRLLVPGVLQEIFRQLPRTICDAITLCRMLNVRYLWVDALCLLQNDAQDLERGVNVMDQIYERSWFTIVAAAGTDANAGLPGVQVGSRRPANFALEVQPGILLGVNAGLDRLLENSMYSSRGWTYVIDALLCSVNTNPPRKVSRTRALPPGYLLYRQQGLLPV